MEEQIESSFEKLSDKILGWLDTLIYNLPNLIIALLVFTFTYWISGKLEKAFQNYLSKIVKHAAIRTLLARLISTFVVLLGIILALYILNLETTIKSLLAGAGLAGLAISFALQGTLSNTLSGLLIVSNSDIEIGDWVEINGISGEVMAIELRNTKLRLSDKTIVFIPNKLILDTALKNYSKEDGQWINLTAGIGNQSDLNLVKSTLLKAIQNAPIEVVSDTLEMQYTGFAEEAIYFDLQFMVAHIPHSEAKEIKSRTLQLVQAELLQLGVPIIFPLHN